MSRGRAHRSWRQASGSKISETAPAVEEVSEEMAAQPNVPAASRAVELT